MMQTFKDARTHMKRFFLNSTRKSAKYKIGTYEVVIPQRHMLPDYQQAFPLYDRYFLDFLSWYSDQAKDMCVIDIGANVGDTALAVLSAAPESRVICVEGAPEYLTYLRQNVGSLKQVQVLEGFVTFRTGNFSVESNKTTARLSDEDPKSVQSTPSFEMFSPLDILSLVDEGVPTIWKSDTDGFDIPILLGWFDEIVTTCEIIWIEFDPILNSSDPTDVTALIDKITGLDRDLVVFDNFGCLVLRLHCDQAGPVIMQLSRWLQIQSGTGHRAIPYFDFWILPEGLANHLVQTASTSSPL